MVRIFNFTDLIVIMCLIIPGRHFILFFFTFNFFKMACMIIRMSSHIINVLINVIRQSSEEIVPMRFMKSITFCLWRRVFPRSEMWRKLKRFIVLFVIFLISFLRISTDYFVSNGFWEIILVFRYWNWIIEGLWSIPKETFQIPFSVFMESILYFILLIITEIVKVVS